MLYKGGKQEWYVLLRSTLISSSQQRISTIYSCSIFLSTIQVLLIIFIFQALVYFTTDYSTVTEVNQSYRNKGLMIWAVNRYVQRYRLTDRPLASTPLWPAPWIQLRRASHYSIIKISRQLDNNKSILLYLFYRRALKNHFCFKYLMLTMREVDLLSLIVVFSCARSYQHCTQSV